MNQLEPGTKVRTKHGEELTVLVSTQMPDRVMCLCYDQFGRASVIKSENLTVIESEAV